MLHPNQFQVNEAWIAFQLNDAPLRTDADGYFNCLALMDAASCFILSSTTLPASEAKPSKVLVQQLLEEGWAHKQELPKTLFIPRGQFPNILPVEAEHQGITVVRVPEDQLLLFIGEVRETFKERFGKAP